MSKRSAKKRPAATRRPSPKTEDAFPIDSIERLKAIANPLRQQILEQFAREPATTKQVADKLGYQATRLYHHVAKLEQAGLIQLVDKRQVRGTIEKYYSTVATRMRVDPDAFGDASAILAGELAGLGVVESMLGNVRNEVAGYLGEVAERMVGDPQAEKPEDEVLFAQAEVEVDDETVRELRRKIADLIDDCERTRELGNRKGRFAKKYRLLIGWFPRASDNHS